MAEYSPSVPFANPRDTGEGIDEWRSCYPVGLRTRVCGGGVVEDVVVVVVGSVLVEKLCSAKDSRLND